jgi:hypothetical protein
MVILPPGLLWATMAEAALKSLTPGTCFVMRPPNVVPVHLHR